MKARRGSRMIRQQQQQDQQRARADTNLLHSHTHTPTQALARVLPSDELSSRSDLPARPLARENKFIKRTSFHGGGASSRPSTHRSRATDRPEGTSDQFAFDRAGNKKNSRQANEDGGARGRGDDAHCGRAGGQGGRGRERLLRVHGLVRAARQHECENDDAKEDERDGEDASCCGGVGDRAGRPPLLGLPLAARPGTARFAMPFLLACVARMAGGSDDR